MPASLVVLGCRVPRGYLAGRSALGGALGRRVVRAARLFFEEREAGRALLLIASGGCRQGGSSVAEADAMARELARLGVPPAAIVRERCSLSTRENAAYSARLLRLRGIDQAIVVTCDWHLARALAAFRAEGLTVSGAPVAGPPVPWRRRIYVKVRERIAARVDAFASSWGRA